MCVCVSYSPRREDHVYLGTRFGAADRALLDVLGLPRVGFNHMIYYIYMYIYIYIYMYTYVYTFIYAYIHVCMHVCNCT